ncbi:MAG: hypothetical protein ACFFDN_45670 [Candidatus Hodarchaeota archaeon]
MISINYKQYRIQIFNDETYSSNSVDNLNKYDYEYTSEFSKYYNYYSKHGVRIFQNDIIIKSAILCCCDGGSTVVHNNSAILNNDSLIVCVGSYLYNLNVPSLKLNWLLKADSATCFEVFYKNDMYIVHGELEISQVTKDGNIVWQFSGKDIFTTQTGINDFIIKDKYIVAKDWEYNVYHIDFNGKGFIVDNTII